MMSGLTVVRPVVEFGIRERAIIHPQCIEPAVIRELPTAVATDAGIRACPRSGSDWPCIIAPTDQRAVGAEARRHAQSSLLDTG